MTHPMTDEKLFKKFWYNTVDVATEVLYTPDGMRTAYDKGRDDQLEQVMKWLDKNICNYTDADYLGDLSPLYKVEGDLKKAMRPQEDNS